MKLEHANITVTSIERTRAFLQLAMPEIRIRGGGPRVQGGYWQHIGTDDSYIALQEEAQSNHSNRQAYIDIGTNHLGITVDDIQGVCQRLAANGYKRSEYGVEEAGRTSVYFYDADGLEWEFVQYHSNDIALSNSYE